MPPALTWIAASRPVRHTWSRPQAFTAFCGLMARVRANFLCGMEDMHRQLRLLGEVLGRLDGRLHRWGGRGKPVHAGCWEEAGNVLIMW